MNTVTSPVDRYLQRKTTRLTNLWDSVSTSMQTESEQETIELFKYLIELGMPDIAECKSLLRRTIQDAFLYGQKQVFEFLRNELNAPTHTLMDIRLVSLDDDPQRKKIRQEMHIQLLREYTNVDVATP